MKCIIWDLDNCLSNDAWRIPMIDHSLKGGEQWARYHAACGGDKPGNLDVFDAIRITHADCVPIFITGRPEAMRQTTHAWIRRHLHVEMPEIMMRDEALEESSVDLKRRHVRALKARGAMPVLAFDDREDIVQMYASESIPTAILRIHGDMSPHGKEYAIHAGKPEDWADVDPLAQLRPNKAAPQQAQAGNNAEDNMLRAIETFRSRNAEYGAAYKSFGKMVAGLFPRGIQLQANDAAGFGRLALMVLLAGKLHRYAVSYADGGHRDSAHDAICYAAMLEELTDGR